jgi:UDP-N-acetylglucosamine 2-epimerase (non-hydrolysing)
MKNILFIFGTRPEAIKLAPLIKAMERETEHFQVTILVTGQHRDMLDQVLSFFEIIPHIDLRLMKPDQSLFELSSDLIRAIGEVLGKDLFDGIIVQGDTTTAFIGALAGFYKKIPVIHVEAGLRSYDKFAPFPEEINRILTDHLSDYFFTPTPRALDNLHKSVIKKNAWIVGNTVIDALLLGIDIVNKKYKSAIEQKFNYLDNDKNIILVTGHRRESFGEPFLNICRALKTIADARTDVQIIYPVHLNPNIQKPVYDILNHHPSITLLPPLEYPEFIWLMKQSYIILTDSGGIQEEAPALGKPVLVMRDVTERTEGIETGTARLVGTNSDIIVNTVMELLDNTTVYRKMAQANNPYGDGTASQQIVNILKSL